MNRIMNGFSIDFEEYFHAPLFGKYLNEVDCTNRAGKMIEKIINLLDKYQYKATFFLLSDTLKNYRDLVIDIINRGHEIGFHGYTHNTLHKHTRATFRKEIENFLNLLKELEINIKLKGYRAPVFSLNQSTSWVLQILEEYDFLYSSSIFPVANHVYGVNGTPLRIYRPDPNNIKQERDLGIIEFPLSIAKIGFLKIPVSGGFYFRILPYKISEILLKSINKEKRPFVFYFHPWELDSNIPRVRMNPLNRLMAYHGTGTDMLNNIECVFKKFEFSRLDRVLGV